MHLVSPELTESGDVLGTPRYMAPEQVRGGHQGARSDIYGLGATFFELFSGAPPYREKAPGLVFKEILAGSTPTMSGEDPDLPRDLVAVVAKAMASDPAGRYADPRSLAEDLVNVRQRKPVTALPRLVARLVACRPLRARFRPTLSVVLGMALLSAIFVMSAWFLLAELHAVLPSAPTGLPPRHGL